MLLDDIATFLAAESTAFHVGATGNLAKQILLDSTPIPETIAVLYETPGGPNEYTFSTSTGPANVDAETPSLQLLSRAVSYQTARNQAETAYTILDGLSSRTLPTATGTRYREITADQAPFFLQRDDNDRYIVSVNFTVKKGVG
jgi:hypothetical protein